MRPRRKAIPPKVKLKVFQRQKGICMSCHAPITDSAEYDHRPAIISRPVNAAGTDYDPPQLDPEHIEALHPECHQQRTTGRRPGAERTVTTKGSDIWLKTKFARLEKPRKRSRMGVPRGFGKRPPSSDEELDKAAPLRKNPGRKIPSRPFRKPTVDRTD